MPIDEKQQILAATISDKWFRLVEEAAVQCKKRRFIKEKENVKKRQALEEKNAQ
ncbi:hypothetical protein [Hyphomonas sp.]|uniref:hypothetical protein n=1 Tax=Hyphomonas sp. TaxID=87 RepID=UPI00329894C4